MERIGNPINKQKANEMQGHPDYMLKEEFVNIPKINLLD